MQCDMKLQLIGLQFYTADDDSWIYVVKNPSYKNYCGFLLTQFSSRICCFPWVFDFPEMNFFLQKWKSDDSTDFVNFFYESEIEAPVTNCF